MCGTRSFCEQFIHCRLQGLLPYNIHCKYTAVKVITNNLILCWLRINPLGNICHLKCSRIIEQFVFYEGYCYVISFANVLYLRYSQTMHYIVVCEKYCIAISLANLWYFKCSQIVLYIVVNEGCFLALLTSQIYDT